MMRHDRNMMPSARRPMRRRGCREFLRVTRLSAARTTASVPRPATHSAATSGTPFTCTPPTMTQGRNVLEARTAPAASGMK